MIPTVGKWTHEKGEPLCRINWIGHGQTRTIGSSTMASVRFLHLGKHYPGVQHRLGSNQSVNLIWRATLWNGTWGSW